MKKDMPVDEMTQNAQIPSPDRLSFYRVMEQMMGDQRQIRQIIERPPGLPAPPRSPEEIKVQMAFDSCIFKTGMSCVLGKKSLFIFEHAMQKFCFRDY